MVFKMATSAQNRKVGDFIVRPIMVDMMNIHMLFSFFAETTDIRKILKSYFSISSFSMYKLTIFSSTRLRFITAFQRTKNLFKVFCSGFAERKIISAIFTLASNRTQSSSSFKRTFSRTTYNFCFRKSKSWNLKRFFTNTAYESRFLLSKISMTLKRTKKVFMPFDSPGLNSHDFFTRSAVYFHIQNYNG